MAATVDNRREEGVETNLVTNYVGTHPYSFSAAPRVQKYYPLLSQKDIHKELSSVNVYSKFRKKKKSKKQNPIYVHYRRHLFQVTTTTFKYELLN